MKPELLQFPPDAIPSEQAVLGCALLDPQCAQRLVTELSAEDFTIDSHRIIFAAIKDLVQQGLPPDPVSVYDKLKEKHEEGEYGGLIYLTELPNMPTVVSEFDTYVALIKDRTTRRRAHYLAVRLAEAAAKGEDWTHFVGQLQALTVQATQTHQQVFVPLKEWQQQNPRTPLIGDLIGAGELVLLYSRPKTGKSILCANLVKGVAEGSSAFGLPCRKGRVGIIALEDRPLWYERLLELDVSDEDVFLVRTPVTINDLPVIKRDVLELNLSLLIIDPLSLFLRPLLQRERASLSRDYDAVYAALFPLREFALETGCTILMVHHERKESANADPSEIAALGSTALTGMVDVGIQLNTKTKDGERLWRLSWWGRSVAEGELWLRLRDDLRFEPTEPPTPTTLKGRAMVAIEAVLREQPYRYSDLVTLIKERVGCSERTAKVAIAEAERQGLIVQRPDKLYELVDTSPVTKESHNKFSEAPDTDAIRAEVQPYNRPLHQLHQQLSSAEVQIVQTAQIAPLHQQLSSAKGAGDYIGLHQLHKVSPQACNLCGNKLSEISATPTCPFCWVSGDEIVAHCDCGSPLHWEGAGKARCPQCGRLWRWATDQWQPDDPEPNEPPDRPSQTANTTPDQPDNPDPAPEPNGERLIETEAWLQQLETEFVAQGKSAPFGNASSQKEAHCPRCGHQESVDAEVLLPPLCPVCGATMEWVSLVAQR